MVLKKKKKVKAKVKVSATPAAPPGLLATEASTRYILAQAGNARRGHIVDVPDSTSQALLVHACQMGRASDVERLLLNYDGRLEEARDANGGTALHITAARGFNSVLNRLLFYDASAGLLNARELECVGGRTALLHAVAERNIEAVHMLVAAGADVNLATLDRNGDTPLHLAAKRGEEEIAQILIDHGADARAVDRYGFTPSYWARENGHAALIETVPLPPPRMLSPIEFRDMLRERAGPGGAKKKKGKKKKGGKAKGKKKKKK